MSNISQVSSQKNFYFFIFINTKSGYGQGKQYLKHNFRQIKYKFQSNRTSHVYLCDLFNKEQKASLLTKLKQLVEQQQKYVRVVISGGDGTILWVVNQIMSKDIDPNKIVFAINPIGTGNDFSRSIGWGFNPLIKTGSNFKQQLAKQILIWMNSEIINYDLWDVEISTYSNGEIYDIKDQVEIRKQETKITKIFSNYVGMGLDARVVYTVQRKRTKNAFINKIIYGCVGFCNFFKSLKNLDKLSIKSQSSQQSTQLAQKLHNQLFKSNNPDQTNFNLNNSYDFSINQTDSSDIMTHTSVLKIQQINYSKQQKIYQIKKGYRGVVCLNCPSYMCGLTGIWNTKKIAEQNSKQDHFQQQKFDDGQVQFIAYKNQLDLALQRIVRSGAKLAQGQGPFIFTLPATKSQFESQNYIQIDGESIKVVHLKQIKIQKTSKIKGSQLKVLFNNLLA